MFHEDGFVTLLGSKPLAVEFGEHPPGRLTRPDAFHTADLFHTRATQHKRAGFLGTGFRARHGETIAANQPACMSSSISMTASASPKSGVSAAIAIRAISSIVRNAGMIFTTASRAGINTKLGL